MIRTITVIAWLVTAFFLFAGTVKLVGWPARIFDNQMTTYFDAYGISRDLVRMIGVAELFGGMTIWLHRRHWVGLAGAATLVVVTSGAIVFLGLIRSRGHLWKGGYDGTHGIKQRRQTDAAAVFGRV